MTNYLIVVPRGNTELFDLLSVAFRGHTGFEVVIDRRGADSPAVPRSTGVEANAERRGGRLSLGPDEIAVAERAEQDSRPAPEGTSRSLQRIPVRRRRVRSSTPGVRGASPQRQPQSYADSDAGFATSC
jgi:hypothetical protein